MKTITALFLLAFATIASVATTTNSNGHVSLLWNCPTNQMTPDVSFKIYETADLAVPMAQWNVLTNISATNFIPFQPVLKGSNWVATNLVVHLDVQRTQHFFFATASNFWGESDLSDYASTPPAAPLIGHTLTIQKDP